MPVRVRMHGEWVTHDEGVYVEVSDGHLLVKGQVPNMRTYANVAIYAPGQWFRSEVVINPSAATA